MIKVYFMGDFFPGGVILDSNIISSNEVSSLLKEADIRVATLETAIGEDYSFDEEKMANPEWRNIIYTPNRGLEHLKKFKIDVVSLANNHIFDMGEEGLKNTIDRLDKMGIEHCGAGINDVDARTPAVLKVKNKTIAFLAYMHPTWRAPHPAGLNKPGINLLFMNRVVEDIKKAKERYDYVFVLPHWGLEYTYWPLFDDHLKAKQMIDAGANGVFGSHTHQVQSHVKYKSQPIYHSLGNFLFPDFYMDKLRPAWYPKCDENTSLIPTTYEYLKEPTTVVRRVWKKKNRIGIIAKVSIENRIECAPNFIILDSNNCLQLYKDKILNSLLCVIGFSIRTPFYNLIHKIVAFIKPGIVVNKFMYFIKRIHD